jgi:hypothetical protein
MGLAEADFKKLWGRVGVGHPCVGEGIISLQIMNEALTKDKRRINRRTM